MSDKVFTWACLTLAVAAFLIINFFPEVQP